MISTITYRGPMAQLAEHRAVTQEIVSVTTAGPTLRVLKYLRKEYCLRKYISKWFDVQVFADYKR